MHIFKSIFTDSKFNMADLLQRKNLDIVKFIQYASKNFYGRKRGLGMKMNYLLFILAIILVINIPLHAQTKDDKIKGKTFPHADLKQVKGSVKPNIPKEYEELVKAFDAYWEAARKNKYDVAYGMESKEHLKGLSLEQYKAEKKSKPGLMTVEITSVTAMQVRKLNEREVIVEAIVGYKAAMVDTVKPLKDRWIKDNEGWKHVPMAKEVKPDQNK